MLTVYKWKAKRSGGRITVDGFDVNGAAVKIAEVDSIECRREGRIVAVKVTQDVAILSA